jgi:hypothetical protein
MKFVKESIKISLNTTMVKKESKVDNLRYWGGMIVGPGTTTGWNWLTNYIDNNNMAVQGKITMS